MSKIFTGAKAKVYINEVLVAFASGVNVSQENTLTDVDVLGQLNVKDLAETGHRVNGSINTFKELDPESNKISDYANMDTKDLEAMKDQPEFNLEILDSNNKEVYFMENCKWEGGTGNVDARGVWNGTWNFRARRGYGL